MEYKKKWRPSVKIKTVEQAVKLILSQKYVFYRHKVYHFGWTRGWSLAFISTAVKGGWLRKAKENV
jgi:hypothetical protein